MPKIDLARVPVEVRNIYPEEFAKVVAGRARQRVGDAAGLTQFGVNICRLKPGAASSLRHWHREEDELIYVIEGEVTLVEEGGETLLRPGDFAGFKANVPNGHCLVNKSARDITFLEIGTRAPSERSTYADVDLVLERDRSGRRFLRKSGVPYEK
jgi:uncharacterized cupin superfamily protein